MRELIVVLGIIVAAKLGVAGWHHLTSTVVLMDQQEFAAKQERHRQEWLESIGH